MRAPLAVMVVFIVALMAVFTACAPWVPPAPPAARQGTVVEAPSAKTWDAVIDVFAERNLPVRAMDRASGFISTDPLAIPEDRAKGLADCGQLFGSQIDPDRATYNALVRGDSTQSRVKVTVRYTQGGHGHDEELVECTSTGAWETRAEADVKARAERR